MTEMSYNQDMQFVRVRGMMDGVQPLSERFVSELSSGKRVLWLVPGGSNIPLSIAVMDTIQEDLSRNLTIMLTDERYGPIGHKDSNTVQLELAGFRPKAATFLPVLRDGANLQRTVESHASDFLRQADAADVIIGQLGMGADGHIAGILPGSNAITSSDAAFCYATPNFTRITLTPPSLRRIDAAYIFAFGQEKQQALADLADKDLDLAVQPAQIIKQISESYVYNDQINNSGTGEGQQS